MSWKIVNGKYTLPLLNGVALTASTSYGPIFAPVYDTGIVIISVSAVSGTSPSMTVTVNLYDELAYESGYNESYYSASSPAITTAGGAYINIPVLFTLFGISISISGTSPSFTTFLSVVLS